MAKAAGRKLKVFQAQFGFYDTVVAAASQSAALRAWGTHQNLFASGQARVTTDEAAVAAATAHPETPLRKAIGSTDPFALEPSSLPTIPDAPRGAAAELAAKAKPVTPTKPLADRSKLNAAENALRKLDEDRKREEAKLRSEADKLEARRMAAQAAFVEARKAATSAVVEARTDYRQAGGED
jgi:hypothetical protein